MATVSSRTRKKGQNELVHSVLWEEKSLEVGEKGVGLGTESAACTWQSKEAINHEDNTSSPLSGSYGVWGGGLSSKEGKAKAAKEEEQAGEPRTSRRNTRGRRTSRRSRQKVNRLPGSLLVLLTNFSIHWRPRRRLLLPPPSPSSAVSFHPLAFTRCSDWLAPCPSSCN